LELEGEEPEGDDEQVSGGSGAGDCEADSESVPLAIRPVLEKPLTTLDENDYIAPIQE